MVPAEEVTAEGFGLVKLSVWVISGLVAIISTGFWRMMSVMQRSIKDNELKIESAAKEFAQHQTYLEKEFVRTNTLTRLYDVIEKIQEDLNAIRVMVAKKGH